MLTFLHFSWDFLPFFTLILVLYGSPLIVLIFLSFKLNGSLYIYPRSTFLLTYWLIYLSAHCSWIPFKACLRVPGLFSWVMFKDMNPNHDYRERILKLLNSKTTISSRIFLFSWWTILFRPIGRKYCFVSPFLLDQIKLINQENKNILEEIAVSLYNCF